MVKLPAASHASLRPQHVCVCLVGVVVPPYNTAKQEESRTEKVARVMLMQEVRKLQQLKGKFSACAIPSSEL